MTSIDSIHWRKSSYSSGGANCVEVAFEVGGDVGVRDSKNPGGPVLAFAPATWRRFTQDVVGHRFGRANR